MARFWVTLEDSTSNAIQVHFHTKEEAEVFWVGSGGSGASSRRMSLTELSEFGVYKHLAAMVAGCFLKRQNAL